MLARENYPIANRDQAGVLFRVGGLKRVPIELPPVELQASPDALQRLTGHLTGWSAERIGGSASKVWLRSSDGTVWLIEIHRREVRPLFEVFTLGMFSMAELHQRWEGWAPSAPPNNVPEVFRRLLTTRPPAPKVPTHFDPWPLRSWRTEVIRRTEFNVEGGDAGRTLDDNRNMLPPIGFPAVAANASAFCKVAAGLLFTGNDGRRLLLAVNWMPMDMLVVEDAADINTFGSQHDLVSLEACPAPASEI